MRVAGQLLIHLEFYDIIVHQIAPASPVIISASIERASRCLHTILHALQRDPSLWQNELGRKVLRMLGSHSLSSEEWQSFISTVPLHCSAALAAAVRNCNEYLAEVERLLRRQADALP